MRTLILCFIAINFTQAQVEPYVPLVFENYEPIWQHTVVDDTHITDDDTDKYSHFMPGFLVEPLEPYLDDGFMYVATKTGYWDQVGYVIEKLDVQTGERLWTTPHDIRHTGNIQENPFDMEVVDGMLRVYSYRSKTPYPPQPFPYSFALAGDPSVIAKTDFDLTTGELINSQFADPTDPTTAEVRYDHFGLYEIYKDSDDEFIEVQFKAAFVDEPHLGNFIVRSIDEDKVVRADTSLSILEYEKVDNNYGQSKAHRIKRVGKDSIIALNYVLELPFENNVYEANFTFYDDTLGVQRIVDITDSYTGSLFPLLIYTSGEDIIFRSSNVNTEEQFISCYDWDGAVKEIFSPYSPATGDLYSQYEVLPIPGEDRYLMVGYDYSSSTLDFTQTDGQGNLTIVKQLTVADDDYVPLCTQMVMLPNRDILALINYGRTMPIPQGTSFMGNWQNWIRIAAEDLNLLTSTTPVIASADVNIYPNPTADYVTITNDRMTSGPRKLSIVDSQGRLCQEVELTSTAERLDVSDLPIGTYVLIENGKSVGQFVKM